MDKELVVKNLDGQDLTIEVFDIIEDKAPIEKSVMNWVIFSFVNDVILGFFKCLKNLKY